MDPSWLVLAVPQPIGEVVSPRLVLFQWGRGRRGSFQVWSICKSLEQTS